MRLESWGPHNKGLFNLALALDHSRERGKQVLLQEKSPVLGSSRIVAESDPTLECSVPSEVHLGPKTLSLSLYGIACAQFQGTWNKYIAVPFKSL